MKAALIVIGVILGFVVISFLALVIAIEAAFRKNFYKRSDGAFTIDYAHFDEYKSLRRKPISFPNDKGNVLRGYIYRNAREKNFKALVVIVHGIGGGHAYLYNVIDALCRAGFLVLGYDMTGCGVSEGKCVRSIIQAIPDIKCALAFIKKDPELDRYPLYLFGHSWGGFAVLAVLNYPEYDVAKCVSVAGFNSEVDLAIPPKKGTGFARALLMGHDLAHYGKYAKVTAFEALKTTKAKVLFVQGENDPSVDPTYAGKFFATSGNPNVQVMLLPGKGHTPFVTPAAEELQAQVLKDLGFFGEKERNQDIAPIDFHPLSVPDEKVYRSIIDFYLS